MPTGPCRLLLVALVVATGACGGGQADSSAHGVPSTSTTVRLPPSPHTTAAAPATIPCVDLLRWGPAELARELIVVPSLDFDLPQLGRVVHTGVGGVLFLGSAPAPTDLGVLVRQADDRSPAGVPLLVMADEEGGGIQRLRPVVADLPWPRDMAMSLTPGQVSSLAARVGAEMRAAGVNVDLAPVLDVDGGAGPDASDPDGRRSFSGTPATAATYGRAFSTGLRSAGVVPVVKHFPGLGGSSGNTDDGPASTPPLSSLQASGLQPFRTAVAAGAPAVMVANASVPGLTRGPASVSAAVIQGLLRSQLGFRGLVMTDSLSAGSIGAAGYDVPGAAAAAVEAGADMVLFGSTRTAADADRLRPEAVTATTDLITRALTEAVAAGRLPTARLRDAARRVLALRGAVVCGR